MTRMPKKNLKKVEVFFEDKSFVFLHKDDEDHIFSHIKKTGAFYEQELLGILRSLLRPGDWVVDVGANIGNHSIYFAGICNCRVLAFEPNPVAAEILRATVRINGLEDKIEIHEVALGARPGRGDLLVRNSHNLGMVSVRQSNSAQGTIRIETLSKYVGSRPIRLLKIDAEGMDYDVLTGALDIITRDNCAISIEASKREEYLRIAALVEERGYLAAGSHNYTPTHIFINKNGTGLDAIVQHVSRQLSLDYIGRAEMRDNLDRKRQEEFRQIADLSMALRQHLAVVPEALAATKDVSAKIGEHIGLGLLQLSRELSDLIQESRRIEANNHQTMESYNALALKKINGFDAQSKLHDEEIKEKLQSVAITIGNFERKIDQNLGALVAASDRYNSILSGIGAQLTGFDARIIELKEAIETLDTKTSRKLDEVADVIQAIGEQSANRNDAMVNSIEIRFTGIDKRVVELNNMIAALDTKASMRLQETIETIFHYNLIAVEIDNLHDATEAHLQRLERYHYKVMQDVGEPLQHRDIIYPIATTKTSSNHEQLNRTILPSEIAPALLDLQYENGAISNEVPVRHQELVSIIMPSYNNATWLKRAINSVLSQQGVRLELLLIDDGSTDGSVSLARKIAGKNPHIRVISLLRNFGCYYARNIGVMHAKGDYITILVSRINAHETEPT